MITDTYTLTNPDAQESAVRLYRFLCSLKGNGILSGQQECPRDKTNGRELSYIK